MARLYSA
ncbi:hypothetical protein YPPY11_2806, partial [Yersinia pestis PY-11]